MHQLNCQLNRININAAHNNDDNELPSAIARMPATTMAAIESDAAQHELEEGQREGGRQQDSLSANGKGGGKN